MRRIPFGFDHDSNGDTRASRDLSFFSGQAFPYLFAFDSGDDYTKSLASEESRECRGGGSPFSCQRDVGVPGWVLLRDAATTKKPRLAWAGWGF